MTPHTASDDAPWDAITRYVTGESPDHEMAAVQQWIAADPANATIVDECRRVWDESRWTDEPEWDARSALKRIKQRPDGPARVVRLPRFYRGADSTWAWTRSVPLRVAAALVVAVGGAGLWHLATQSRTGAQPEAAAISEVTTPSGQRAALNLPDGTHVVLGPASTIRYSVARDRGARTIQLEGQAYFVVTHDAKRPFTVRTAYGVATDLGTKFDIRAYPGDSGVVVAVAEGQVALADALASSAGTTLEPGQLGRVDAKGEIRVRSGVDLAAYVSWTQGRLQFADAPLREVVASLARWYDLDIRLADPAIGQRPIGQRRFTAAFEHEGTPEMLSLLARSLELRVERNGRTVTLSAASR